MDIQSKLKQKKNRKIALIVIGILVLISIVAGLMSIEGKDAKLADGQGNVVVENAGSAVNSQQDSDTKAGSKSDKVSKMSEAEKAKTSAKDIKIDNSKNPAASNEGNRALKPKSPKNVTVTLEIRCDTVSKHMDVLKDEAIAPYIPKDGVILAKTTYKGTTENTVFDALNTLCRNNDIQIEYSYTPAYESYYVEGINFLYEFDCGNQSGWIYKVNGWAPNYGCSSYYLRDGDVIVWAYTVKGLGEDVGVQM